MHPELRASHSGARVLGAHVEGPFLHPDARGAHNADWFRDPDSDALAYLTSTDAICLMTLAPERAHALDAISWLRERGVIISIGHSTANEAQTLAAIERGAKKLTHLFNAMPSLHHRSVGLAAVGLTSDALTCGLIVDGIHVHPRMVKLAYRSRGAEGIVLVTDAMAAMGMPHGTYHIGDKTVTLDATGVRLPDGRLAGSALRMDDAVRNMVAFSGCTPAEAIHMATAVPARVIGADDSIGHVREGCKADLLLLDDSLNVQATIIRGDLVYATEAARARFAAAGLDLP